MILKGLSGKLARFVKGRLAALRETDCSGQIPPSCIVRYFPDASIASLDRPLVIFFSGDGGWANLTSIVSDRFQKSGYPVVGVDCMQYFWDEKTPENAARELANTIRETASELKCQSIILMGYSMGADVLPIITRHLPNDIFKSVSRMILMSASDRVILKFRFTGWLGYGAHQGEGFPLFPDLEVLSKSFPIACFAGENETDSIATSLPHSLASVKLLPGGHHYASDYRGLSRALINLINDDL